MKALIRKILPMSAVDGPGNRSVIFFQGCNLNCSYCHNPETVNCCSACGTCIEQCPAKALAMIDNEINHDQSKCLNCDSCLDNCPENSNPKAYQLNVDELVNEIGRRRDFISGITLSGGECTLQYEFLLAFLRRLQEENIPVFLDTNGYIETDKFKQLLELCEQIMLDIKALSSEDHIQLTGQGNDLIWANFKVAAESQKIFEIRTVIYPTKTDTKELIKKCAATIRAHDDKIIYKLIKYRSYGVRNPANTEFTSPDDGFMNELKNLARQCGINHVTIV